MSTPLPWSYSSLDNFINCPRSFYEQRVVKSVKDSGSEATEWGTWVHTQFEHRQRDRVALPPQLAEHEPYMQILSGIRGEGFYEQKVALAKTMQPTSFFGSDVWWRGIIDYKKISGTSATIIDYKTGKVKPKFQQLMIFALHTFAAHPEVSSVKVFFYWTQTKQPQGQIYTRDQIPELWSWFIPHLKQYREAFKTDTWQERPSGLCGWCPVTQCKHWRPRPPGR